MPVKAIDAEGRRSPASRIASSSSTAVINGRRDVIDVALAWLEVTAMRGGAPAGNRCSRPACSTGDLKRAQALDQRGALTEPAGAYASIVDTYGPFGDVAAPRARISVLDADSRFKEMRRAEERTDVARARTSRRDSRMLSRLLGAGTGLDRRTAEHGGVAVDDQEIHARMTTTAGAPRRTLELLLVRATRRRGASSTRCMISGAPRPRSDLPRACIRTVPPCGSTLPRSGSRGQKGAAVAALQQGVRRRIQRQGGAAHRSELRAASRRRRLRQAG